MVKIGINGFGRLGRHLLKVAINKCKEKCATEVSRLVMVNDASLSPDCISYILRNDSFYGKSNMEIVELGSSLMIDGQRIEFTRESKVETIPWNKCQVEYVIDTTGENITCDKASRFFTEGIKRVIVPCCSKVPIFIVGVNHSCFDLKMKTVSAATPQLNCLMPLLRVLHENFQIMEAVVTAIHPLSNNDKILDDMSESGYCRNSRSSLSSFSPIQSLTQGNVVERIMPELEGKLGSTAIKVPIPCVGAIILTAKLGNEAPLEVINCRLKEASDNHMKGIMSFSTENLVSTDVIGDPHSCIVDSKAGISISKCLVQLFAWYDSEFSFANRLYDLANYISSREGCPKS